MSEDIYSDFANRYICGKLEHRKAFPDCDKCAAKIAAIAAAFDESAKRSHVKKERDPALHKRIKEVDADESFTGERSPYWNHLFANQATSGEDGGVRENVFANPDVLSDEEDFYDKALSSEGEIQMQAIHEAMAECSPQQQKILALALSGVWSEKDGQCIYGEQAIANEIGVTRETVKIMFTRIRSRVRRHYKRLKAAEGKK